MKRLLGALALVLLTSGCAYQHSGHPFDSAAVAQLQPGVSTERDMEGWCVRPSLNISKPLLKKSSCGRHLKASEIRRRI